AEPRNDHMRVRVDDHREKRRAPAGARLACPSYFLCFFLGVTALYACFHSDVSVSSFHVGGLPAAMLPSFTFSKTVRVIGATPRPLRLSGHQLSCRYSLSAVFVTARL